MARLPRRKAIENELNGHGAPLTRTLSIESISSLFKRNRKRKLEDDSSVKSSSPTTDNEDAELSKYEDEVEENDDDDDDDDNEEEEEDKDKDGNDQEGRGGNRRAKKRRIKTKEEEEFEEKERKLDEELPEEYRKFRPRGFRFNIPPKDKPIRIYADGVFDLFHLGHMKQLEQAKKSFENVELVCGIPSDKETHKRKGLTVLTDEQRCETLKHCKWVDEVIPNAPWCVTPEFLREHNIDYVAHDDLPYASSDSDDIYKPIKEQGMFLTTQRTEGISTSDIITKIIRDYDKYLMRNFARGATRKELNVSWLKKNELEFKKHINDFRTYWMRNKLNINNVSRDLYFEIREFMRGKKFDVQQYLENQQKQQQKHKNQQLITNGSQGPSRSGSISDFEDSTSYKGGSPLTDFASKYIGNANKELNNAGKVILKWIHGEDDSDEEEIKPIVIKPVHKARRRSSSSSSSIKPRLINNSATTNANTNATTTTTKGTLSGAAVKSTPKKGSSTPRKTPQKKAY
ncbi:hypothetical protein LELG_04269 [Lodderomyces elongisporus NRRL YB-4239]|uniref:choline-phosphate cytidylyltransferase n=1 Tax=Lodderomyces elongisporus (strain ATCC 11503 / CBS 2605 / JCM 1781 / NBRC 1676 / NRRL YB-4239) TaxID=379508 RepID=A5E3T1_LODEL|nr:hypothetical protein LELG_04269 [Lodderomyces elongisporus NRRL YB-4239]